MSSTIDHKLDLMARSLQEHINLAKELNLNFVAQLLTMTAMEIRINLHRISEQEMDTLCARAEQQAQSPAPARAAGNGAGDQFPGPRSLFLTGKGSWAPCKTAKAACVHSVFESLAFWRFADVIFCIKSCPRSRLCIRHMCDDVLESGGVFRA